MKKLFAVLLSFLMFPSLGIAAVTHFTETLPPGKTAGCIPVANGYDWSLSCDSPAQPTTINGTATVTTSMIFPVQQFVALSSFSTITPGQVYLILASSGNNITMAGAGSNNLPPIATATATNGQFIILTSTSNGTAASVTLSSGTNAALDLGAATRVLANGKTLGLLYNSTLSEWVELFYGNN